MNNVGYIVKGHMLYLSDGNEVMNRIENNLMISGQASFTLSKNEQYSSCFYFANPKNIIIGNAAVGCEFYGFQFNVGKNPTGPSVRNDICPNGMNLVKFENNTAHSNGYSGLFINDMKARDNMCKLVRNDSNPNPFIDNRSIQMSKNKFEKYKFYFSFQEFPQLFQQKVWSTRYRDGKRGFRQILYV